MRIRHICYNEGERYEQRIAEENNILWKDTALKGLENGSFFYFVHSYFVSLKNEKDSIANSENLEIQKKYL